MLLHEKMEKVKILKSFTIFFNICTRVLMRTLAMKVNFGSADGQQIELEGQVHIAANRICHCTIYSNICRALKSLFN